MNATERLYEEDSYLKDCTAEVVASEAGLFRVNRTVLYAEGGGQPGDSGAVTLPDGQELAIVKSVKQPGNPNAVLHYLQDADAVLEVGSQVKLAVDWARRHRLMRMHSALHLLCAQVSAGVTGGSVGDGKGRIDFNIGADGLDKERINDGLNELVARDLEVAARWITADELDENPDLVRTMEVQPPRSGGKVRLIEVQSADLQPCGGTHVKRTSEIGALVVGKIENKGKQNRRVNIRFAD